MSSFPIFIDPRDKEDFARKQDSIRTSLTDVEWNIFIGLYSDVAARGYGNKCHHGKAKWWTGEVNGLLRKLGEEQGYSVRFENSGDWYPGDWHPGEWLFDFVWLDVDSDGAEPIDRNEPHSGWLKLACESEWKRCEEQKMLWDFCKLTLAAADLRLFIYSSWPVDSPGSRGGCLVEKCKKMCPRNQGFRYFAVGFPDTKKNEEWLLRLDAWTA